MTERQEQLHYYVGQAPRGPTPLSFLSELLLFFLPFLKYFFFLLQKATVLHNRFQGSLIAMIAQVSFPKEREKGQKNKKKKNNNSNKKTVIQYGNDTKMSTTTKKMR